MFTQLLRFTLGLNLLFLLTTHAADAQECSKLWTHLDSRPYLAKLFIDSNNTYWRFRFQIPAGGTTGLRIKGEYPYSRYLSFNVYDQNTFDSSISLTDRNIQPDPGSSNPFWDGVDRRVRERNYQVLVVPHGAKGKFASEANVVEYPETDSENSTKVQFVEIWYRVYFPDEGSDENGSVPLPTVESFNVETLEPTACPTRGELRPPTLSLPNLPPRPTKGDIFFYHSPGSAIYALPDNQYLVSHLTRRKSEVYVFRFKAPHFSNTYSGGGNFDARTQVRYWSICVAGLDGTTGECLPDSKAKIAKDGFVNLVVGSEELRDEVLSMGLNFVSRGNFFIPIILYRNLLAAPDFEGDVKRVPIWESQPLKPADLAKPLAAHHYIGDYGPRGAYCSTREFFRNYCTVPISF